MSKSYFRLSDDRIISTANPELWEKDGVRLSAKEGKVAMAAQAVSQLRAMLKPGDTVYTILRQVSASGMSRRVSVVIVEDGRIRDITVRVADVCGYSLAKGQGLAVNGCGMDAGFDVVYNLGGALWPNGTPEPHGTRNGEPDSAGSYALRHEWL